MFLETQELVHLVFAPLMLVIFYYVKAHQPKKINNFYGYRTPASKRSQATWDFANEYSTEWMIKMMWILMVLQLVSIVLFDASTSIMVATFGLIILMLVPILMTEQRLRQMFDKEGNWKDEYV